MDNSIGEKLNMVVVLLNRSAKTAVQVALPLNTGLGGQRSATSAWITQSVCHIPTRLIRLTRHTCLSGSETHGYTRIQQILKNTIQVGGRIHIPISKKVVSVVHVS